MLDFDTLCTVISEIRTHGLPLEYVETNGMLLLSDSGTEKLRSLKKLGLTDDLLGVKKEPLRAIGPILWPVSGVPDKDLLWKKGRDDLIRFAVNEVVMIYTAEHLLAAYGCYFDSIKNVTLNEETYEFHYQDIVSVATSETSTSYTLPNKEKLVHDFVAAWTKVMNADRFDLA